MTHKYSTAKIALWVSILMSASLVATFFDASNFWFAGFSIVVAAACLFALSSPMQLLLIDYSPGGELLGGAMVQIAFNLGNAIGAFAGGLALSRTGQPEYTSLVGAIFAIVSIVVMSGFIKHRLFNNH